MPHHLLERPARLGDNLEPLQVVARCDGIFDSRVVEQIGCHGLVDDGHTVGLEVATRELGDDTTFGFDLPVYSSHNVVVDVGLYDALNFNGIDHESGALLPFDHNRMNGGFVSPIA